MHAPASTWLLLLGSLPLPLSLHTFRSPPSAYVILHTRAPPPATALTASPIDSRTAMAAARAARPMNARAASDYALPSLPYALGALEPVPPRACLQGYLAHKKTPTPRGLL